MNINQVIKPTIRSYISKNSEAEIREHIKKINIWEMEKLQNALYVVLHIYLQIGKPDSGDYVFEYRNKNEMYLAIQPKIKSYVIFENEETLNQYLNQDINKNELYLVCNVNQGKIIL